MGEEHAKSHSCSTCGAPLALDNARDEILRCRYCGSDHRVICAKSEAEAELRAERRVGAIAAPYLIGPLLGFAGFFAVRDFMWSPYEGTPAMIVAFLFLVIGLMSFRIPAALGLAVVGLAGILKPFVRPIASNYGGELHYYSPTSETAFYYLVPGVISAIVGFLFFSSLKVRELGPASRALIPRASMVLATAAGLVGGYFFLGDTSLEVARRHKALVDELVSVATAACDDTLIETLKPPLSPAPSFAPKKPGNVLMVACARIADPNDSKNDPFYLDQLSFFRIQAASKRPSMHAGATPWQEEKYLNASRTRYVIAYRGESSKREVVVANLKTRAALKIADKALSTDAQLYAALANATGGSFPKGKGTKASRVATGTSAMESAPPPPIFAEFDLHTTRIDSLGNLWFYGMATNTSTIPTNGPEVLATLKDANGKELRVDHGYAAFALEPGQTSPVAIMSKEPPEYASFEFEIVPRRLSTKKLAKDLTIVDTTQSVSRNTLSISGTVRNDGNAPAKFVQVHALSLGEGDKLMGIRSSYVKAETLEPGAEARFLDKVYNWDSESMRVEFRVTGTPGRR